MNAFHFDGYTVRPVGEWDRVYLESLIQADLYHCDRMDADYFLKPLPGETSWALEDATGTVLFYFKTTPAVRMSIQFTGNDTLKKRTANMEALTKGLAWMEATLAAARFREILFDTEGPELTLFARRRLGFVDASGLMVRGLSMPDAVNAPPSVVGTVPTNSTSKGDNANVRT